MYTFIIIIIIFKCTATLKALLEIRCLINAILLLLLRVTLFLVLKHQRKRLKRKKMWDASVRGDYTEMWRVIFVLICM